LTEKNFFLSEEAVALNFNASNPEEAIRKSGELLVKSGVVDRGYIDSMIDVYKQLGAYIVLAPNIAMPHARPGQDVLKIGYAFLRLEKPIFFGHPENDPVKILIPLAGTDHFQHIKLLQNISEVLSDKNNLDFLFHSESPYEISELFNRNFVNEE